MTKRKKKATTRKRAATSSHALNQPRCYTTHKPLVIPVGKKKFQIAGGNCGAVKISDYDIVIALDSGSLRVKPTRPWQTPKTMVVDYSMPNMGVPHSQEDMQEMVKWLAEQVTAKKNVHVGCIGGHGRTGLILTALYAEMTGDEQSLKVVRETYCNKAVESFQQLEWLHKMYGIEVSFAIKELKEQTAKISNRKHHRWWEERKRGYGAPVSTVDGVTDLFGRRIDRSTSRLGVKDIWPDEDDDDLVEDRLPSEDDFFTN